ncbi:MAG: TrbC/VirB2 family protein [Clostridia bacterium]
MKKSKKIMLRALPVLMILMVVVTANVFGFSDFTPSVDLSGGTDGTATLAVKNVWNIILTILQVAAVAAVVFAGVRYMFASADDKAGIKKSMGTLAIGAILVFGASTVISFLTTVATEVL